MSSNPPGKSGGKSILLMQQRLRAKDVSNASSNESANTASNTNNNDPNVVSSSSTSVSGGVGLSVSRPSSGKSAAQLMMAQERMKHNSSGANPSSSNTNHPTSVAPVPINRNSKPKGKDFSAMARSQSQTNVNSLQPSTDSVVKSHVPALPAMEKDAAFAGGRSTGKGKDFAAMLNKSSVISTPPADPVPSMNATTNQGIPQMPSMNLSGQPSRYPTSSPIISTNPNLNGGNVATARPMFPNPPTHPLSTNAPLNTNIQTNNIKNSNSANNAKPAPMPRPGGRAALIAESARVQSQRRASGGSANDLNLKQTPQNQPPPTQQQQQQHQQQLQQPQPQHQQKKQELLNQPNTNIPNISLPMRNSFNALPQSVTATTLNSTSNNSNGNNGCIPTQAPKAPSLPPSKPTPKPTIVQSKLSSKITPPPSNTYTITGIKLQNLLSSISPHYTLDTDAQDQILQLADDFIDKLVSQSMKFAKHRDSKNVDVKDIKLALQKQWGMNVEGFGLGNEGASKTDSTQKGNTTNGKVSMGNGKNGSRGVKRSINDLVT